MSKVVCFGELLWDLMPDGAELGGAPSNFAYRMRSLGHETVIVSRVGDDESGRRAIALLKEKGVGTDFIQMDTKLPTGTVKVQVNERGEPDFEIVREVAYDGIELTQQVEALAATANCVCFGTLAQRSERSRKSLYRLLDAATSAKKVLDINLRKSCYTLETIQESLRRTDILKLNSDEVVEVAGLLEIPKLDREMSALDELGYFAQSIAGRFSLEACVVTRGGEGSLAFKFEERHEGREHIHHTMMCSSPGFSVSVQDTCGSGDAFTAGFMHQYLAGASLEKCCSYGNALGALVAQTKGGMTPVSVDQIEEFLMRQNQNEK
jgi:fructokinase